MPEKFDFEAFISGFDVDLPRFEVPLYRVLHQARIYEIDREIAELSEADGPADERESSTGVSALVKERDRLVKEQNDSAEWLELRALTAQEFDALRPDDKTQFDQLAAQSQGTRNEMPAEAWERIKATALPGAWYLFNSQANEILSDRLVMPDFSLSGSEKPGRSTSSKS